MTGELLVFVIFTDFSRKENPAFYLNCMCPVAFVSHLQTRAVTGAPLCSLSASSSPVLIAAVSVRSSSASHFH